MCLAVNGPVVVDDSEFLQLTGNDELIPSDPGFSHKRHFFFRGLYLFFSIKVVFLLANLREEGLNFHLYLKFFKID